MSESFHATVRALSHKGHGVIDHPDSRVLFVKGTWPGEEGIFRVDRGTKSYEYAELIELTKKAPERIHVPCPHRGDTERTCGGCPWMMINYESQIKAKEQRISFLLDKNKISFKSRLPLIPSPKVFGYRNRAQFKTNGKQLGYVSEGTNNLVPIQDCLILNDKMRDLLSQMKDSLPNKSWAPTGDFSWSYLDVDDEQNISDVLPNKRRPFRQGNSEQNLKMKDWILQSLAGYRKDYPIMEAFCGSGNFTECISQAGFTNILAAEVRGSAIAELKSKNLSGVRIMEIDMTEKGIWQQLAKRQPHAKILLVDPPREGIEKRKGIFKYLDNLEIIIYISCEPTTWARDIKDFQENGWYVDEITPLDMFPHTPHVEILSILKKPI